MFAISMACLFSVITSSSRSSSSGYCLMRASVVSFSITISFDLSDVVKYTKVLLSSRSIRISRFCIEWRSLSSSLSLSRSMMRRYRRYMVALRYRICRMKRVFM